MERFTKKVELKLYRNNEQKQVYRIQCSRFLC